MTNVSQAKSLAVGRDTAAATIDLGEFKRGWRILVLGGLGISTSVTAAMLYAFSAFVIPIEEAFDWRRGDVQATMTFLSGGAIIAMFAIGWLNRKYGSRQMTLFSLVALMLGYLSFVALPTDADIRWFYFGYALLPLLGMGNLPITWTQLIGMWFTRSRGLALAIVLSGTGISGALLPTVITWAIQHWDWRAGFVIMAVPLGFLMLPLALLWFRPAPPDAEPAHGGHTDPNKDLVAGITSEDALLTRRFWLCNLALTIVVSGVICMLSTAIPLMQDKGLSALEASQVFATYGITLMVGRLAVGYLLDRLWAPGVAAVTLSLPALGCIILATQDASIPAFVLAMALIGMGAGAEFDLSSFLLARYFGMLDYGRLYGLHMVFLSVVAAASPLLIRELYGLAGNYSIMLQYCIAVFLCGAAALLLLGRYPRFG